MTAVPGARPIDPAAEAGRMGAERIAPRPPDPAALTALLRECVTVVKPGEVLVVRIPPGTFLPVQFREYSESLNRIAEPLGIRALVVIGDELGVAQPAQEAGS